MKCIQNAYVFTTFKNMFETEGKSWQAGTPLKHYSHTFAYTCWLAH